ncbi:MAG: hypothetical protein JXQ26_01090 [Tissierellales bacterium]|nr:hypothetical protein [Tissierellales bacterium]MBN2826553.1 hypothetical protein [Tissierellales bacterium]
MKKKPSENIEQTAQEKKSVKKRKKFLWILIPCVILLLLGTVGFMMRDTIYKAWIEKNTELQTVNGIVMSEETLSGVYVSAEQIDAEDWRNYPDTEKIQGKIEDQLKGFAKAAKSKNVDKMLKYLCEANKERYEALFTENRDQLDQIAPIFEEWTLVFLSEPIDKKSDSALRVAECSVMYEGQPFSIVFIEENGKWLINNF